MCREKKRKAHPARDILQVILANFIHERWVICCRMARYSRLIYEECMKWVTLRKAFGKPLSDQAVIRAKLGAMLANVDAGQAYLEREFLQETMAALEPD